MINKEMGFVVQIEHFWDIILFKIIYLSIFPNAFQFWSFFSLGDGFVEWNVLFFNSFGRTGRSTILKQWKKKNGIEFVCRQRSSKQKILGGGGWGG